MASKEGKSYTQEEMQEEIIRFFKEIGRLSKEMMERDEKVTNIEDYYNAEEMNIIANEKMLRRRRERFMRPNLRRRRKKKESKSKSSQYENEESFMSDSDDEEMKIAQEEAKRVMEKAIRENMTTARDEVDVDDDGRIEELNINGDDEKMFPRRRGRFIRYLRRTRSKSQDSSALEIEFQHLRLPMAEESSFMSYSSDEENMSSSTLTAKRQ